MEANWSNGEQCRKVAATSQSSNVATFQRRDVGSTNTEVNNQKRRDVSTRSAPHHLKHQWFRNRGIERRTNEGTELESSNDTDFEEVPVICIVSHLLDIRLMFLRLKIFIFSFSMF